MVEKSFLDNKINVAGKEILLGSLEKDDIHFLLNLNEQGTNELAIKAREITNYFFGNKCFIRGVIEFSNICKVKCKFCPMNVHNKSLQRYLLDKDEFINSIKLCNDSGIQTIMLQSGEATSSFNYLADLNLNNYREFSYNNFILCIGDLNLMQIKKLIKNGYKNYILKFETFNSDKYQFLKQANLENRIASIDLLKKYRANVGSGLICGLPGQSERDVVNSLTYIQQQRFPMNSVSPFIAAESTEFSNHPNAKLLETLKIISILRLLNPTSIIPSVSALNLLDTKGQIRGLEFGANEITINFTPINEVNNFQIYTTQRKVTDLEKAKNIIYNAGVVSENSDSSGIKYVSSTEEQDWYKNRYSVKDLDLELSVYGIPSDFYVKFINSLPTVEKAIELACGDGKYSFQLAKRVNELTVVDKCKFAINRLIERQHAMKVDNLRVLKKNLFKLNESGYDVIVCANLIHDLDESELSLFFDRLKVLAKKDAYVYICFESGIILKDSSGIYFNLNRLYNYTLGEVVERFEKSGFKIEMTNNSPFIGEFSRRTSQYTRMATSFEIISRKL